MPLWQHMHGISIYPFSMVLEGKARHDAANIQSGG